MPTVKFLLITANVGSLFEEATKIHAGWMSEILKLIQRCQPSFIALHMQEIGGKDYQKCMGQVNDFINKFYEKCSDLGFTNGRGYIDEDFISNDKFTALGSLYLLHKDLSDVFIYNFETSKFESINNFKVCCKLLNVETTVRRQRFPPAPVNLFGTAKWSRKGFMRTRWKIQHKIFNLVNIHLFHDACNIVAAEQSPSVYSAQRKEALQYALQTIEQNDFYNVPLFIFGDFNFRLDTKSLVETLIPSFEQKSINNLDQSLEYRLGDASSELILRLGTKVFDHSNHENLSQMNLLQFDKEVLQFPDLHELRINFSPSYPFCEDIRLPSQYMKTRAPAWCDRILMNSTASRLIEKSPEKTLPEYNLIGENICMGDHKPVYLSVNLAINENDDCNSTGERSRPMSSSFGVSQNCFCSVCLCYACSCHCNARCTSFRKDILFCNHDYCAQKRLNVPISVVEDNDDDANITDDLKVLVSHFVPSNDYDRVENRHVITVNADSFVYRPTICINPDLEYVTTITLYDDSTVSVMDASSYGLTLNNETPLDDRSIWWLTEKIKKSFSSFSDVSGLKQISSGSSIPYYCKQQFNYHASRRDAFGRGDLSESASYCSEKFALMKLPSTNDSFINEAYVQERLSPPNISTNLANEGKLFVHKMLIESENVVDTNLNRIAINSFEEDIYSKRELLATDENKMRIRIEYNDGDRGENLQYSSIITIEGEGGEPEIVYGKPRIFETSSNLTFSHSSNKTYDDCSQFVTKQENCRSKLGFFVHPNDQRKPICENKTRRRHVDVCKSFNQTINTVSIEENQNDFHGRSDEMCANRNSYQNMNGRRRLPGRKFFESGAHSDYVHVDWWAVNFLNSFNKSQTVTDLNEPTYERRPLFDPQTETRASRHVPCCRFL